MKEFDIIQFVKMFFTLPKPVQKELWHHIFTSMTVHTRKRKPDELLLSLRPNEEPHIHQFRIANYRAITYGSMNRAFDATYRMICSINYSIVAPDTIKTFIKEPIFMNYTLQVFLEKIFLKRDIEDPNGIMIWLPTGAGVQDNSQSVIPQPFLFYSEDIYYMDTEVLVIKSDEKSIVQIDSNGQESLMGDVYYIITKMSFFKLIQVGLYSNHIFETHEIYAHKMGEIPAIVLGGDLNAEGVHESYFSPYLAFGDEAVATFSDWQASKLTAGHPIIEEFELYEETKFEGTEVDKSSNPIAFGEEKYKNNGERKVKHSSPYGIRVRKVPAKDSTFDDTLGPEFPSRRYISPDVEALRYTGDAWKDLVRMAEESINVKNQTLAISGAAKEIDNEDKYSMITKIGNNYFNVMQNCLRYISGYQNKGKIDPSIKINKPEVFRIKTEMDLVNEISTLKEKNVPALFLSEATIELSIKRFSGNPVSQKIFNVIILLDPLFVYSVAEKREMVLTNVVHQKEFTRSTYAYPLLMRIAYEKTAQVFIEMSYEQIVAEFDKLIEPYYIPEILLVDPASAGGAGAPPAPVA